MEMFQTVKELAPESQGDALGMTVLCVPTIQRSDNKAQGNRRPVFLINIFLVEENGSNSSVRNP